MELEDLLQDRGHPLTLKGSETLATSRGHTLILGDQPADDLRRTDAT